jgi:hypothetical protein
MNIIIFIKKVCLDTCGNCLSFAGKPEESISENPPKEQYAPVDTENFKDFEEGYDISVSNKKKKKSLSKNNGAPTDLGVEMKEMHTHNESLDYSTLDITPADSEETFEKILSDKKEVTDTPHDDWFDESEVKLGADG